MTPIEWKNICDKIADVMTCYTRPFVTPLSTSNDKEVRLVGSGSYVIVGDRRILLTCEHVASVVPIEYRFYDSELVFRHPGPFMKEGLPIDAAFAQITDDQWNMVEHHGALIPYERFALTHRVADRSELLFFRGFAGENSHYGFEYLETNASGYCSQEKVVNEPNSQIFEIFWEPKKIEYTESTTAENRKNVRYNDPRGLSGSLVWNTRYIEVTTDGRKWGPDDAVVTGLLCRFDDKTKTLLALRIEHLRTWINDSILLGRPFESPIP